jgi:hypothetical protein
MSQDRSAPSSPEDEGISPNTFILIGLAAYAAGAIVFFHLAHLEETGGRVSLPVAVALVYKLGGKWLLAAFMALVGTISLVVGVKGRLKSRSKGAGGSSQFRQGEPSPAAPGAPAATKRESLWPLFLVFGLLFVLGASFQGDTWVVTDHEAGGAVRFRFSMWAVAAVVGYAAVVLRVWWYCRAWHIRVHLALLALGGIPVIILPTFVENYVLVDDDHVEWSGRDGAGNVRYADSKEVDGQGFVTPERYWQQTGIRFGMKNGHSEYLKVSGRPDLVAPAAPEILRRARQAGVRVREQVPQ